MNRKAVSPVIAVLLMIAIAVAAAILVYVWSMGLIGTLQTGGGQQVREQVIMDAYNWKTATLTLYLRNVGSQDVTIAAIYIEGAQAATMSSPITIQSLITVTGLSAVGFTPTSGAAYTIKVITITGAVFTFSCIYGKGT